MDGYTRTKLFDWIPPEYPPTPCHTGELYELEQSLMETESRGNDKSEPTSPRSIKAESKSSDNCECESCTSDSPIYVLRQLFPNSPLSYYDKVDPNDQRPLFEIGPPRECTKASPTSGQKEICQSKIWKEVSHSTNSLEITHQSTDRLEISQSTSSINYVQIHYCNMQI